MRRNILFLTFLLSAVLSGCSRAGIETMIVASETRTCYGAGRQQCMLVRGADTEPWQYFYGNIEGFDYEPGYEYVLRVGKEKVENPPQDASSIRYRLVKLVSREKIASRDLPSDVSAAAEPDMRSAIGE